LISISIGPPSPPAEFFLTYDQTFAVKNSSPLSCLPIWDAKTIEAVGLDVDDISSGGQTQSQNKHVSITLMTCVLGTSDPVTYSDSQGQPEWE
jgi:hypothetical protein